MLDAWQRPETVIVHEWVWNSLAKRADIVLPCTTPLERNDLGISRSSHMVYMTKVVEAPEECRNDFDILKGVAARLGVEREFTEGLDEAGWLQRMYESTRSRMTSRGVEFPDYEAFRSSGWARIAPPRIPSVFLQEFRKDPVGHRLETPSGKIEIYSESVARFGYVDCPGHAAWIEPVEWLGDPSRQCPLHLISNQPGNKLHSQLDHGSISMADKRKGRERLTINPLDAGERGIVDGDVVLVLNERGSCLAVARLSDSIMRHVVQMSTGAWFDPTVSPEHGPMCVHGNPNALTIDKGTSSLAQGPIAHTCLVDVKPFEGTLPEVTAHVAPPIRPNVASR